MVKLIKGVNDLGTLIPELAKEWHPTKNGDLKPCDMTCGSKKKIWWQCKRGHEWQCGIVSRRSGNGCPICSGHQVLVGYNDLRTVNSELVKEWHPTKNGNLKPEMFTKASSVKVWWQCSKGHEWEARIFSRVNGNGCPICAGKKVLIGYNDLKTVNPELAKQWHPVKNGDLTSQMVTAHSGKTVWWKCDKGHEWQAVIADRSNGIGCPECKKLKRKK